MSHHHSKCPISVDPRNESCDCSALWEAEREERTKEAAEYNARRDAQRKAEQFLEVSVENGKCPNTIFKYFDNHQYVAESHDKQMTELRIRRVSRDGKEEAQIAVAVHHRKKNSGRWFQTLGHLTLNPAEAEQMANALLQLAKEMKR